MQFQRNPYKPEMRTVMAAWNRMVVIDKVILRLNDDGSMSSLVRELIWTENSFDKENSIQACNIEQLDMIRPQLLDKEDSPSGDGLSSLLVADKQVRYIFYMPIWRTIALF